MPDEARVSVVLSDSSGGGNSSEEIDFDYEQDDAHDDDIFQPHGGYDEMENMMIAEQDDFVNSGFYV